MKTEQKIKDIISKTTSVRLDVEKTSNLIVFHSDFDFDNISLDIDFDCGGVFFAEIKVSNEDDQRCLNSLSISLFDADQEEIEVINEDEIFAEIEEYLKEIQS